MIKKVIIDCDTGTDDAIALLSGLLTKELDIRAITTVAGNAELAETARNTLDLVRFLGNDVRVAKGSTKPIFRDLQKIRSVDIHGKNGLGDVEIQESNADFAVTNAVETIRDEARQGDLELISIGPLTNIAHAIMVFPELSTLVKRITFMGGAIKGGNVTEVAEFNVCADPEAAKIVLRSGIPLTMVGLDVTERVVLNKEDYKVIKGLTSKEGQIAAAILEFMFKRARNGGEGAVMHDALALASVVKPTLLRTHRYFVDVETQGEYTCGYTFVDKKNITNNKPNCNVAIDVDIDGFKDWLLTTLRSQEKHAHSIL